MSTEDEMAVAGNPVADDGARELLVAHAPFQAVAFDFNGTLSDDEPLLCELFIDIFSRRLGYLLTEEQYYNSLSGLSDAEIVREVLGWSDLAGNVRLGEDLHAEKVDLYQREVRRQPRISRSTAEFVRRVANRVPVVVVTGAVHAEVDVALEAAGIFDLFTAVITADDIEQGKPDPEGFLYASSLLAPIPAARTLVFEDSLVGALAAKAAGMPCVVVRGPREGKNVGGADDCVVDDLSERSLSWLFPFLSSSPRFTSPI